MTIWCDNLCHILDVAFVHFHLHVILALLDFIFGMMLFHDMLCAHKKFHDHLIHFCFNMEFLCLISNCDHIVCLCLILFNWWLCLMIWLGSFWCFLLDWLNMLHMKCWLLFWLFTLPLTLVFALVVCTHLLSFAFQVQAISSNGWCDLLAWDAIHFV
jgi:hypothetical protein